MWSQTVRRLHVSVRSLLPLRLWPAGRGGEGVGWERRTGAAAAITNLGSCAAEVPLALAGPAGDLQSALLCRRL